MFEAFHADIEDTATWGLTVTTAADAVKRKQSQLEDCRRKRARLTTRKHECQQRIKDSEEIIIQAQRDCQVARAQLVEIKQLKITQDAECVKLATKLGQRRIKEAEAVSKLVESLSRYPTYNSLVQDLKLQLQYCEMLENDLRATIKPDVVSLLAATFANRPQHNRIATLFALPSTDSVKEVENSNTAIAGPVSCNNVTGGDDISSQDTTTCDKNSTTGVAAPPTVAGTPKNTRSAKNKEHKAKKASSKANPRSNKQRRASRISRNAPNNNNSRVIGTTTSPATAEHDIDGSSDTSCSGGARAQVSATSKKRRLQLQPTSPAVPKAKRPRLLQTSANPLQLASLQLDGFDNEIAPALFTTAAMLPPTMHTAVESGPPSLSQMLPIQPLFSARQSPVDVALSHSVEKEPFGLGHISGSSNIINTMSPPAGEHMLAASQHHAVAPGADTETTSCTNAKQHIFTVNTVGAPAQPQPILSSAFHSSGGLYETATIPEAISATSPPAFNDSGSPTVVAGDTTSNGSPDIVPFSALPTLDFTTAPPPPPSLPLTTSVPPTSATSMLFAPNVLPACREEVYQRTDGHPVQARLTMNVDVLPAVISADQVSILTTFYNKMQVTELLFACFNRVDFAAMGLWEQWNPYPDLPQLERCSLVIRFFAPSRIYAEALVQYHNYVHVAKIDAIDCKIRHAPTPRLKNGDPIVLPAAGSSGRGAILRYGALHTTTRSWIDRVAAELDLCASSTTVECLELHAPHTLPPHHTLSSVERRTLRLHKASEPGICVFFPPDANLAQRYPPFSDIALRLIPTAADLQETPLEFMQVTESCMRCRKSMSSKVHKTARGFGYRACNCTVLQDCLHCCIVQWLSVYTCRRQANLDGSSHSSVCDEFVDCDRCHSPWSLRALIHVDCYEYFHTRRQQQPQHPTKKKKKRKRKTST